MSLTLKISYVANPPLPGQRLYAEAIAYSSHNHRTLSDTTNDTFPSVFYLLSTNALPSHQEKSLLGGAAAISP